MAYLVNESDSDMIDDLVIDSNWCVECFEKAMIYKGSMLKTGAPRCDILFGDRTVSKRMIRAKHNLSEEAKIVLFAPTFREGSKKGKRYVYSETWTIDFERLLQNLQKRFGGEWYLCLRVHPQLADSFSEDEETKNCLNEKIIDESEHDDFYEILAGVDAYITDYSSAIFEAGYAHIPAFIYADDIEEYNNQRDNLYWNIMSNDRKKVLNNKETHPKMHLTLTFTVARNNYQIEEDILEFDYEKYNKKLALFHDAIGLVFDGNGSKKLVHIIEKRLSKQQEII